MNKNGEKITYHYGAKKYTFQTAKKLRKESTHTEKILWKILRSRKFNKYKFRRQHPVGRYVADYYCHQSKLVIELDGEVHEDEEQKYYDIERDKFMEEMGLNVLRIKNEDVTERLESVLELIEKNL